MGGADPRLQLNQVVRIQAQGAAQVVQLEGVVVSFRPREVVVALSGVDTLPVELAAGTKVMLRVPDQLGLHSASLKVLWVKGPPAMLCLERPVSFEVTQQRRYFRVRAHLWFTYRLLDQIGQPRGETFSAMTEDVSAGGLGFLAPEQLAPGTELLIVLEVPLGTTEQERKLTLTGRVVRGHSNPTPPNAAGLFWTGIEFRHIREIDRDILVRFGFETQRKPPERDG